MRCSSEDHSGIHISDSCRRRTGSGRLRRRKLTRRGHDAVSWLKAAQDFSVLPVAETEMDFLPAPVLAVSFAEGVMEGDIAAFVHPADRVERNARHVMAGIDEEDDFGTQAGPKIGEPSSDVDVGVVDADVRGIQAVY